MITIVPLKGYDKLGVHLLNGSDKLTIEKDGVKSGVISGAELRRELARCAESNKTPKYANVVGTNIVFDPKKIGTSPSVIVNIRADGKYRVTTGVGLCDVKKVGNNLVLRYKNGIVLCVFGLEFKSISDTRSTASFTLFGQSECFLYNRYGVTSGFELFINVIAHSKEGLFGRLVVSRHVGTSVDIYTYKMIGDFVCYVDGDTIYRGERLGYTSNESRFMKELIMRGN